MADTLNSPIIVNVVVYWLMSNYLEILGYGATILFLLASIFLQDDFSIEGFFFIVAFSLIGAILLFLALVLIAWAWKSVLYLVGFFAVYRLIFFIRTHRERRF